MQSHQLYFCSHCGNPSGNNLPDSNGHSFCCLGCETVFRLIHENGLGAYYSLRDKRSRMPKVLDDYEFEYLDQPDILKDYAINTSQGHMLEFFIEGIHCVGCQYILENLHHINSNIIQSRFDFEKSLLTITLKPLTKVSEIAKVIDDLGYRPRLIKESVEARALQLKMKRQLLIRIGIAAAVSGNIMILSIAVYAGAEATWRHYFDLISAIIALPAILYSGYPFYESSLQALKQKRISIDLPISLAIVLGAIVSYINVFTSGENVYFDSVTGLIFLLLSSRFIQKSIEEKAGLFFQKDQFFQKEYVSVFDKTSGKYILTLFDKVAIGDYLEIPEGEMIPFDGIVRESSGHVNEALLSGESNLKPITDNSIVFQGTMNAGKKFIIEVQEIGDKTRINKILKELKSTKSSSNFLSISDKIGTYFLYSVMILGFLTFLNFSLKGQAFTGLERAISLFIVTCPCALAIGTPLSFKQTYQWLFKKGIILRNMEPIEKILQTNKIFIDKTGTLTMGTIDVQVFEYAANFEFEQQNQLNSILFTLENKSKHPIAKSITTYLRNHQSKIAEVELENFKEILGKGVEADYQGNHFEIHGVALDRNDDNSYVVLTKNNQPQIYIGLGDSLRENAPFAINQLKKMGYSLTILSGDQKKPVEKIAKILEIDSIAELSPETKAQIIKANPKSIMIGDGANDALSLKESFVALCMKGGLSLSLKVSDVYISNGNLQSLIDLRFMAKETKNLIKRNLILSLFYNFTAAYFACTGVITPLLAAIFMPLSSLTIVLSNLFGTKKMREMRRRN
jgi:Cu2+-exporting ATPase/Cu+-exporting ATPase